VQVALDELGYELNAAARSLRSGRTGMIALVVAELHPPYFAELADAVVRAADRRGLTVLVEVTEAQRDRELQVLRGGRKHLTDGVLMSPLALSGPADPSDLTDRRDFPLVMLGESRLGDVFDHVGIDNTAAARAAVEHLVATGRRSITALGCIDDSPGSALRLQGFEEALRDAGLEPHGRLRTPDWSRHSGADAVHAMVASGEPLPDGIFAFNDTLAVGALRALLHHGVGVPSPVAVVGIDDIEEAAYVTPSLTTIAPDLAALAEQALTLLERQMASGRNGGADGRADGGAHGGGPPRREWSPFRLVVRESTAVR
jgi:DNA-binding LacI/PurR family transcriptional regulator